MEDIKSTIQIEVQDVLAELDFLHKVDQRRDLYEAGVVRRAVHRWEGNIKVPNNKKCNHLLISGTSDSGCHYFSSTVRALRKISPLSPLTT